MGVCKAGFDCILEFISFKPNFNYYINKMRINRVTTKGKMLLSFSNILSKLIKIEKYQDQPLIVLGYCTLKGLNKCHLVGDLVIRKSQEKSVTRILCSHSFYCI